MARRPNWRHSKNNKPFRTDAFAAELGDELEGHARRVFSREEQRFGELRSMFLLRPEMLDLPIKYSYLWLRTQELKRLVTAARRSRQIQQEVLLTKLRRNATSAFGRDHGFAGIRNVSDFRRQVP